MVMAFPDDLRIGLEVYVISDLDNYLVHPHTIRGPIVNASDKFCIHDWNGKAYWVYEEPDWSFNEYRRTIKLWCDKGKILINKDDRQEGDTRDKLGGKVP